MPRFVLLYHKLPPGSARESHCDLMLEVGDVLRTWSFAALPSTWRNLADSASAHEICIAGTNVVVAQQLPDHRLAYLEYEGLVSEGRGHVSRLDAGTFQKIRQSTQKWAVELSGTHIRGQLSLEYGAETGANWLLTFLAATK
jgi:hypothetical protein